MFRTREQFVKQRTEAINALRSHLYEFGYVAPEGIAHVPDLAKIVKDRRSDLPDLVRDLCKKMLTHIEELTEHLSELGRRLLPCRRRHPCHAGCRQCPERADQQAQAVAFRMREQLIKQRTDSINALRGYLYEFGYIAPEGIGHVPDFAKIVKDKRSDLPDLGVTSARRC